MRSVTVSFGPYCPVAGHCGPVPEFRVPEFPLGCETYNEFGTAMEIVTIKSIPIVLGREDDGRWWADIESMPGVMAYGATREAAIAAVRALALRVAADCIDHGEEVPEPLARVFSVA